MRDAWLQVGVAAMRRRGDTDRQGDAGDELCGGAMRDGFAVKLYRDD